MGNIETGVDKLVSLVHKYKKISVDKAAKELGVNTIVVQEWADFLEEQGIISIEYSLSRVYLVEKKLNKKEVENKAKEYGSKKESFVRKVETTITTLDRESEAFESIKDEFGNLKKGIGSEMAKVENELKELKKYEDIKKKIDDDITKQKAEYQKILNDAHQQITLEEKRYKDIVDTIEAEKDKLKQEKESIKSLETNENSLKERLNALNFIVDNIRKKIEKGKGLIDESEHRINDLDNLANSIEKDIKEKKDKKIAPLIKLSQEQENKIKYIQEDIIKKVAKAKERISQDEQAGVAVAERFKEFFEKKNNIEKVIVKIDEDHSQLKKELQELVKKAIGFNLLSKSSDVKTYIADLEKKFLELDKRKGLFVRELQKLADMIKH